jgi:hypothetical protein
MMIIIPPIQKEGVIAAHAGTHMSSSESPLGFTFCHYRNGSVERWNFLVGCIAAYFEDPKELIRGEHP